MATVLNWFVNSIFFGWIQFYVAWFPMLYAFLAIVSSRQLHLDRRGIVTGWLEPSAHDVESAHQQWPRLTVIVPTHNGSASVGRTIEDVRHLAWPELEIIAVDDGSTDGTGDILDRIAQEHPGLHILHKIVNEGKSKALNDAIAVATGGLILICDDDALVPPATAVLLAAQLAHHDDLAAVTANPRMLRTETLIEKLQAVEFSSTVSTQRRGHSAWGRISTISGVCTMFRTEVLRSIGGFDPTQPTEDIDITWRLHCAGWRVGYEPKATIGTYPMRTFRQWFRQRRRWAAGLVRALITNWRQVIRPRNFTVWPLLLEAVGSIVWCHLFFALALTWPLCFIFGVSIGGNAIIFGVWGALTLCVTIVQIVWGMHLDRSDDPNITKMRWFAPLFPLGYWMLLAGTVVLSTVPEIMRRRQNVRWQRP